ncbi:hypothetical protein Sjap_018436 [Stephania japonica]|uniref:Uncharacterized protein n=1 Tax=Stephania japonica TaxID=461633 RepID=A0AAP0I7Y7_9MAGN
MLLSIVVFGGMPTSTSKTECSFFMTEDARSCRRSCILNKYHSSLSSTFWKKECNFNSSKTILPTSLGSLFLR